ncbi:MAG: metalloregulator ArsR/SmtB family transcription factor [Roseobacter sp.]
MSNKTFIARRLAALGHEARLDIFRLLVKAGRNGLSVGQIAEHEKMAASTLAHHLKSLVDAGLVLQSKNGREVVNTAHYDRMSEVLDFLTDQCCVGVAIPSKQTVE